jgi:hypothetical protein
MVMAKFEDVDVPFTTVNGRKCLTMKQVRDHEWLHEMICAPHRAGWFSYDPVLHVYFLIEKDNPKYA